MIRLHCALGRDGQPWIVKVGSVAVSVPLERTLGRLLLDGYEIAGTEGVDVLVREPKRRPGHKPAAVRKTGELPLTVRGAGNGMQVVRVGDAATLPLPLDEVLTRLRTSWGLFTREGVDESRAERTGETTITLRRV